MSKIKKVVKWGALCFVLVLGFSFLANFSINQLGNTNCFSKVKEIKANRVGLVLGTAKLLRSGRTNLYYVHRINATVKLFKAGKIKYVLISGDNGNTEYDEPTDFKTDLIKKGIPEYRIFLDYAGFRTLDSVVRAKKVFGLNAFTVISQKFHNERAVFLANKNDIDAIGFNAKDVSGRYGLKVQIREYFARTKAYLDVITGKEPKFLGPKIKII